mmetsp:Transcript_37997/g.94450  ORF Transcript_37997/g.94450 Transcript_37997/m.94450 type:complete len:200 (+) Transcript_37997:549-1148(+)
MAIRAAAIRAILTVWVSLPCLPPDALNDKARRANLLLVLAPASAAGGMSEKSDSSSESMLGWCGVRSRSLSRLAVVVCGKRRGAPAIPSSISPDASTPSPSISCALNILGTHPRRLRREERFPLATPCAPSSDCDRQTRVVVVPTDTVSTLCPLPLTGSSPSVESRACAVCVCTLICLCVSRSKWGSASLCSLTRRICS